MGDWKDTLGQVVGTVVGIALVGGLFFIQCVAPFLADNSETWTCGDPEVRSFCDDSLTIGGFAAEVCGREEIEFTGTYIETIVFGADGGSREPGDVEMRMRCAGIDLRWVIDERGLNDAESIDDWDTQNDQTDEAVDLFREYSLGLISIDDARGALLE